MSQANEVQPAVGLHYPLFSMPLYQTIENGEVARLRQSVKQCFRIDADCTECGNHATFVLSCNYLRMMRTNSTTRGEQLEDSNDFATVTATCLRDGNHKFHFIFANWDGSLVKLGQMPSLADVHELDIKRYRKTLRKAQYREFAKAVGLAANDVGVGSFVYLLYSQPSRLTFRESSGKLPLAAAKMSVETLSPSQPAQPEPSPAARLEPGSKRERITDKDAATKLARQRLNILQLAQELGSVSKACKQGGMDRPPGGHPASTSGSAVSRPMAWQD